jgi:chromosome segregation ATPase
LVESELKRLSTEYRAEILESHSATLQRQLEDTEARLEDQDRCISSLEEVLEAKDMLIKALEEQCGISASHFGPCGT